MARIKTLIVDDHALFRDGVSYLFASSSGIEVVAGAANCAEALEALREHDVDVVLMDYDLGPDEVDGIEAMQRIHNEFGDLPVVMVSMHAERHLIVSAAQAGAAGYVLKDYPGRDLIEAVKAVASGRGWLCPDAAQTLLASVAAMASQGTAVPTYGLSERQREILKRVADGKTYGEISDELFISESRTKDLMRDTCEKLGARGQAQAAAIAVAEGLIPPPRRSAPDGSGR